MSRLAHKPLVTIAIPVLNGAETLAPVLESALGQDYPNLELVVSDNASTDGTEEICRDFARADDRVVYRRHTTNIGLLNNFRSAAEASRGSFVRWLGDDDSLESTYVSRTVQAFSDDERRVLVTTQISYVDTNGTVRLDAEYDPSGLASADPVERFTQMLCLLTSGFARLDPLYGMMRRDLAVLPRRNILREDEVFAARLALAGPWGHVEAPLARRHRSEVTTEGLTRLLGVPRWHRHAAEVLQCWELCYWIGQSSLDPAQQHRARAEVFRMYARRKRNKARRGVMELERVTRRPDRMSPSRAR